MLDSLTPPTDNLYKFIAIGGLAFALVAFVYLLREQATQWEAYVTADIDLRANGYVEGTGEPKDVELHKAWLRREWAKSEGESLLQFSKGLAGKAMGVSLVISMLGFAAWWWRVQRFEDAKLRMERWRR